MGPKWVPLSAANPTKPGWTSLVTGRWAAARSLFALSCAAVQRVIRPKPTPVPTLPRLLAARGTDLGLVDLCACFLGVGLAGPDAPAKVLEIWRIENFRPVPVPSSSHRKFFTGDSYIILKTYGNELRLLSNILLVQLNANWRRCCYGVHNYIRRVKLMKMKRRLKTTSTDPVTEIDTTKRETYLSSLEFKENYPNASRTAEPLLLVPNGSRTSSS
ncbi:Villin headpiece domain [Musa troglodytarum]|uniref:Villin headpiece domain n=1 Tax=Musa troglodytarum TaxID=320322 RepID=A0A9E7E866_9LILI|nr:Villin headpiece domain [Musa troglodytarum]